jgi:hypothetical protein
MAVLIEGISVVVRVDRIAAKARGGVAGFKALIPHESFCADGELVRVGFMVPDDARAFVGKLGAIGLQFKHERMAVDLVVVDQRDGPTTECDWLAFGTSYLDNDPTRRISAAYLVGGRNKVIVTPPHWKYEGSLSQSFQFVPAEEAPQRVKFLRREGGVDVYLDLATGEERYVGRSS